MSALGRPPRAVNKQPGPAANPAHPPNPTQAAQEIGRKRRSTPIVAHLKLKHGPKKKRHHADGFITASIKITGEAQVCENVLLNVQRDLEGLGVESPAAISSIPSAVEDFANTTTESNDVLKSLGATLEKIKCITNTTVGVVDTLAKVHPYADTAWTVLSSVYKSRLAAEHIEGPIIIVMDALDKCGDVSSRQKLLDLLSNDFSKLPPQFRILITSRPEHDIKCALASCSHIHTIDLSTRDEGMMVDTEHRPLVYSSNPNTDPESGGVGLAEKLVPGKAPEPPPPRRLHALFAAFVPLALKPGKAEKTSNKATAQQVHNTVTYLPLNSPFVMFHTQIIVHMAKDTQNHYKLYRMTGRYVVAASKDVIWSNGYGCHDKEWIIWPEDDVLEASLRQYAKEKLPLANRTRRLKDEHGLIIGLTLLKNLNNNFKIPSSRKHTPHKIATQKILEKMGQDINKQQGSGTIGTLLAMEGFNIPRVMLLNDPEGVDSRYPGRKKIKRTVLTGHSIWQEVHCDGHEKLGKLALMMGSVGLPIYGMKEHWADAILYLKVLPNDRLADAIRHVYLDFVEGYRVIAQQMTFDGGSETGKMAGMQTGLKTTFAPDIDLAIYPAVVSVPSTKNTLIEGFWHWLRENRGYNLYEWVTYGKTAGIFSPSNDVHVALFNWLWPPIIQAELDEFSEYWNTHRIWKQKNKNMPSGAAPRDVYTSPEA
ncbi:hypothetical protein HWV62_9675 [Athelia sp. TMB]|nr:hypothetical protein HWV62_9675 [Athelia sp. TMB]